jgi:hypothetical protein
MRDAVLLSLGLLAATPAAAEDCAHVIIECSAGSDTASVYTLNALPRHLPLSWLKKHCVNTNPERCSDWKGYLSGRGSSRSSAGGGSAGSYAGGPADRTVVPEPVVEQAPVARDARGKLGPTMAPPSTEPTSADLLPAGEPFAVDLAAAAQRYKLPVLLLRAVMRVESNGNPAAISPKGAIGLMQLMPDTAKTLGVDDPHDNRQNILGGARFLRILANRFDGDMVKVLSAYHAGSLRVQGRDATPFAATDDYVRKILKLYYQMRDAAARGR